MAMSNKFKSKFLNIPLLISIVSLFVSICSTFYYTRMSNQLSAQARLTELIDKIYVLDIEKNSLKKEKDADFNKISNVQLQMKHLLFEIDKMTSSQNLSQPQNRLLADTFADFLYYEYAQKYWDRVFDEDFTVPELEAEYYRRYAEFLYSKRDFEGGEVAFRKSLSLANNTDNRRYINHQTLTDWAGLEYRRESYNFYLNKARGKAVLLPRFEKAYALLQESKQINDFIEEYVLYYNAVNDYNRIMNEIHHFMTENRVHIK